MIVKCKKCASHLLDTDDSNILVAHSGEEAGTVVCQTVLDNAEVFIHEDHLPEWMLSEIEQTQWTKGKLKCAKCGFKVGSFDFVSGTRCKCQLNSVLPSVHFIRSKVDVRK